MEKIMNLNELKSEIKLGLEDFDFIEKSAEEASAVTDGRVEPSEFNKGPGLYRIMSGSRGIIEEIEKVEEIDIPTVDQLVADWVDEDTTAEEGREYIEEFYMVEADEYNEGVLLFGFTEEEYDIYLKVA